MKNSESKFRQRLNALLRRDHRDGDKLNAVHEDSAAPRLTPLERISKHLRRLGLAQKVQVRFEATAGDFVLEDADGYVHAKDYDDAVAVIERIWLYQA